MPLLQVGPGDERDPGAARASPMGAEAFMAAAPRAGECAPLPLLRTEPARGGSLNGSGAPDVGVVVRSSLPRVGTHCRTDSNPSGYVPDGGSAPPTPSSRMGFTGRSSTGAQWSWAGVGDRSGGRGHGEAGPGLDAQEMRNVHAKARRHSTLAEASRNMRGASPFADPSTQMSAPEKCVRGMHPDIAAVVAAGRSGIAACRDGSPRASVVGRASPLSPANGWLGGPQQHHQVQQQQQQVQQQRVQQQRVQQQQREHQRVQKEVQQQVQQRGDAPLQAARECEEHADGGGGGVSRVMSSLRDSWRGALRNILGRSSSSSSGGSGGSSVSAGNA
jgi:hypothetical protein